MYAIMITSALAIYSLILVDFSFLYKEINLNNDLLDSSQALYTAEAAIELSAHSIGDNSAVIANLKFLEAGQTSENKTDEDFLTYHEGIKTDYAHKNLLLNAPVLTHAPATVSSNREAQTYVHLFDGPALDGKAYYSLEGEKSKSFAIREVEAENNFNEILFEFNSPGENSELLFEIFIFPKEGMQMEFKHFQELKNDPFSNPIKRMVINTVDASMKGFAFQDNLPLKSKVQSAQGYYKKSISISGFQPLENNYILAFKTMDDQFIHFKLSAFYQAKPVILPNINQTIDVIGTTSTGLYQRLKYQRESEEGLAPGYNFVHFSDESIVK